MNTNAAGGLLESAQGFLAEALHDFSRHKLRFAIVHAVTATELVLKARLVRVNPGLILENIDAKNTGRGRTVSLRDLPQRLANLGMALSVPHAQLIATIAEWRNDIVHNPRSPLPESSRNHLSQLLDFLAAFLRADMNMPLETFLPKDLFKVAHGLLDDWQNAIAAARAGALREGAVIDNACPRCGITSVMTLRSEGRVHCHLCGAALHQLDSCDACGEQTVASYAPGTEGNVCDQCIAEAGDLYIQQLTELARGK